MSATAGCLRDIMETDIMDYMHVDHPYNEKEIWKMKHATPARIGIGHCGPRYTTEAELRFLASHAAANDAVYKILFCLSREPDNDICCQRNIRNRCTDLIDQIQIFFFIIASIHSFKDTAAS